MSGSEWRLLQGQVLVAPGKSPRLGGAEADPRTLWRAVMLGLQLLPPPPPFVGSEGETSNCFAPSKCLLCTLAGLISFYG